jgi:hypothetical protein
MTLGPKGSKKPGRPRADQITPECAPREGRPPKVIDWEKVDKWLRTGQKATEIADRLNIHSETFIEHVEKEKGVSFSSYRLSKIEGGNGMLRERQFASAMQGNTRMLELLGEERLGQGQDKLQEAPAHGVITEILENVMEFKGKMIDSADQNSSDPSVGESSQLN